MKAKEIMKTFKSYFSALMIVVFAAMGLVSQGQVYVKGDVFGGGNQANVGKNGNTRTTTVTMNKGVVGSVYGGGSEGSVYGSSTVNVNGGYVGYEYDDNLEHIVTPVIDEGIERTLDGVLGAGFGIGTTVSGTCTVNVGKAAGMTDDVHIYGSVYGGGEEGQAGGGYSRATVAVGKTLPAGHYTYNEGTDAFVTASGTARADVEYYQNTTPNYNRTTTSVTVKSDGTHTVDIEGAVFGGGRGFYTSYEEGMVGKQVSSKQKLIRGKVYGNASVEIGTVDQDTSLIHIHSLNYYVDLDTAEMHHLIADASTVAGSKDWAGLVHVYDVDHSRYVPVGGGGAFKVVNALAKDGGVVKDVNVSSSETREDVAYFISIGRVSVAGGGEQGEVVGSTAFSNTKYNASLQGGNTTVTVHSGTLGDVQFGETSGVVGGDVFGGGLSAAIDGTSRVTFDGATAWCRGDVYGGGCLGQVRAYNRANATADKLTTQVSFQKGWARRVFGGSNLVTHGVGQRSEVVVGIEADKSTEANWDNTLVSQSVFGGNGFSPSKASTTVTMYSGKVGFARAGYSINTATSVSPEGEQGDALYVDQVIVNSDRTELDVEKNAVVVNDQGGVSYDGNVYGGGYGPVANITGSHVEIQGGRIRSGVFGAGELGAVVNYDFDNAETPESAAYKFIYKKLQNDGSVLQVTVPYTAPASTEVEIMGGKMSMVCGGGRGYSNTLKVESYTPGAVLGNTHVNFAGGTVDTLYYPSALGGGNVYGGGLEGVVAGNSHVNAVAGTISNNAFAGGRGFRYALIGPLAQEDDNILYHATNDAGSIKGNTRMTVSDTLGNNGPTIGMGVYGGGEGCNYTTNRGYTPSHDTVAIVEGNALVDIDAGLIGGGYTQGGVSENGSFAGGRIAPIHGYADMLVHGTANVASVYGGNDITGFVAGKNRPAMTTLYHTEIDPGSALAGRDTTSTYVKIYETALVGHVYGGGNGHYEYYEDPYYAPLQLTKPTQSSSYVEIMLDATQGSYTSGYVGQAFAGGNGAEVDTARVFIYGKGLVDTVFGGGNSATVNELAVVNIYANRNLCAGTSNTANVNYLFGGNNQAPMEIVPEINLSQGVVKYVYGGGNAGEMRGNESVFRDYFGDVVEHLSTYILVDGDDISVTGAIFGGSNCAAVLNGTFIDVRNTSTTKRCEANFGIQRVFGGNDISERVAWSRVDVNGGIVHNIFGGGNGHYNYTLAGDNYFVTPYGTPYAYDGNYLAAGTPGRPYTDSTNVNVFGGTINNNIYGGGYAGDCGTTVLLINDTTVRNGVPAAGNANITGKIFGGGNGEMATLGTNKNVGNVLSMAKTDLYHVTTLGEAYAYGGGNAGDVENTQLTVHPAWNQPLIALYGGCYGSNVTGTARTYMNCDTIVMVGAEQKYNVTKLFGGNDYSGTCAKSVLSINNGKYHDVYGAGNGEYDTYAGLITPPNSEEPTVNMNSGIVQHNLYGGGCMGYVFKDTTGIFTNADDYARILVNLHNGEVRNNVFTGGAGEPTGKQLVYGLKQFNMDGGEVKWAVYGGTENVRDGYSRECVETDNTTLRPSTILNFAGGIVGNNVYGGGYLGTTYGSIFINVGKEAIENCKAWSATYKGTDAAYAIYKPQFVTTADADTAGNMKPSDLYLSASIYNGADWGDAGAVYEFNSRGFYGGETRILVDGEGYNTSRSAEGSSDPFMNIQKNIIGSGTSAEGGDVRRHILIRNYGKYEDCNISKELYSIQRADCLEMENTGIEILGNQDAYTAYPSTNLSISRVDSIYMVGHNISILDAPVVRVKHLEFDEEYGVLNDSPAFLSDMSVNATACGTTPICDRINVATSGPYSHIMVKDGMYIEVVADGVYGDVAGYAYLVSEDETQAVITARYKDVSASANVPDGGFFSSCADSNTCTVGGRSVNEYPFTNYSNSYRVWSVGNGYRTRELTIVAHSDVKQLGRSNTLVRYPYSKVDGTDSTEYMTFALAHYSLELPPASDGHYYKLQGSINVDEDNGNESIVLTDAAWIPNDWAEVDSVFSEANLIGRSNGAWDTLKVSGGAQDMDARKILAAPNTTFGLAITSGANFASSCHGTDHCTDQTVISGNTLVQSLANFETPVVSGSDQVVPNLDFYLSYSPNFTSTILREIKFTLMEYNAAGAPVAPINVTVSIATIVDEFRDEEYELLAMYNEGTRNEFVRKMTLPASLERRDLYMTGVVWQPCLPGMQPSNVPAANAIGRSGWAHELNHQSTDQCNFQMVGSSVAESALGNTKFGIELIPTEDISGSATTGEGWKQIVTERMDLYDYADIYNDVDEYVHHKGYADTAASYSDWKLEAGVVKADTVKFKRDNIVASNDGKGVYVGVLDGRATAAINLRLRFNGEETYQDGYVGNVVVGFDYYTAGVLSGHFNVTIRVKTRERGDTIYMASRPNSLTRHGVTVYQHGKAGAGGGNAAGWNTGNKGKEPNQYVTSFSEALAKDVYQEGDVLCIMDTLVIRETDNVVLRGSDYNIIPVIRYSGNHYQMPGDSCAYRGPMVRLRQQGRLTTYNMIFDGSALSKRKVKNAGNPAWLHNTDTNVVVMGQSYNVGKKYGWVRDTLAAVAPIFLVEDAANLHLSNRTTVQNNWNKATSNSGQHAGADATFLGGAVQVVGVGSYTLGGNTFPSTPDVKMSYESKIENCFTSRAAATAGEHSGAIYLNKGTMTLGTGQQNMSIKVIDNYYDTTVSVWNAIETPKINRLTWDNTMTERLSHVSKSNVYLTRTTGASKDDPDLVDGITDMVQFSSEPNDGTRIGISKWFPGPTSRDTMQIAFMNSSNPLFAARAYSKGNFVSDTADYKIFYNATISPYTIYLFRCASFRKQVKGEVLYDDVEPAINQVALLQYNARMEDPCPKGGDTLIYSVKGGFYPYNFLWESASQADFSDAKPLANVNTPYSDDQVKNDVTHKKALESNSNALALSVDANDPSVTDYITYYRITATDLLGCEQQKTVEIHTVKQLANDASVVKTGLSDTALANMAQIERVYKGVRLTKKVESDGWGDITAMDIKGNAVDFGTTVLCQGDQLELNAVPNTGKQFIMWDFDPYDQASTHYVVPASNQTITAYFGPTVYWKDAVKEKPAGYTTDYDGTVHVTSPEGLAWCISVINGLNGEQSRPFYFDSIIIHNAANGGMDTYDMANNLWTPMGSAVDRFRGKMKADDGVVIKNIIVNEPRMPYVGFFAHLDTAKIENLNLQRVLMKGSQYVGGIAAEAYNKTKITNCQVTDDGSADDRIISIISGTYATGGMVGRGDELTVTSTGSGISNSRVKYMGSAIYSGGVVGYGNDCDITSTAVRNDSRMSALYCGGVVGYSTATNAPVDPSSKQQQGGALIANNYVHMTSTNNNRRIGGIVGYAHNTLLDNNYVYGEAQATDVSGALGAMVDNSVQVNNCFYQENTNEQAMGANFGARTENISSFNGMGNQINMNTAVGGVKNLTRVLNYRAREVAGYKSWRSDLLMENHGYPVFGDPDLIPVYDTVDIQTCDYYTWNDTNLYESGSYSLSYRDSVNWIDSTVTLVLTIDNAMRIELTDTITLGQDYDGHGFYLTADEVRMLSQNNGDFGVATLQLVDSLLTIHGCDSVVRLNLTVTLPNTPNVEEAVPQLSVFPNPTSSYVDVEVENMISVELYDNSSRRLVYREVKGDSCRIDLQSYPSGTYFVRVRTEAATSVKKIIKR